MTEYLMTRYVAAVIADRMAHPQGKRRTRVVAASRRVPTSRHGDRLDN